MRYVRHVSKIIRGRVAKWEPAPSGAEVDGKEYFWSDDPMFETMGRDVDGLGMLDRHGTRQWELKNGKVERKTDLLTAAQQAKELERRFKGEYPRDIWQQTIADAHEAQMDDAPSDDPAFVALKAMQSRRRAIKAEVDLL